MSMISGLIDELNKSADEWNGSNMFELARMCREAADTIWQLRDDLQRANTDNAKLRELVRDYDKCLDTALELAGYKGFVIMPDQKLFSSLQPRARELGIEAE